MTSTQRSRAGLAGASVALFAVVGLVAIPVRGGSQPLGIDNAASSIVGSPRLGELMAKINGERPWPPGLVRLMAGTGLPLGAATIAIGLALVAWRRGDARGMALCVLGPTVAVLLTDVVVKPLVDRHRGGGLAYPSGHATGAAAVAVVALLLLYRWGGCRALVRFGPGTLALPALMGLALIRFRWHYPTDVVGGTAMGAATAMAIAAALGSRWDRPSPRRGRKMTAGARSEAERVCRP